MAVMVQWYKVQLIIERINYVVNGQKSKMTDRIGRSSKPVILMNHHHRCRQYMKHIYWLELAAQKVVMVCVTLRSDYPSVGSRKNVSDHLPIWQLFHH